MLPASNGMNVVAPVNQAVPFGDAQLERLFDEGNLLKLLVAIRGSSMPSEEKMQLRDLVLEYSQLDSEEKRSVVAKQVLGGIAPYQSDFTFLLTATSESEEPAARPDAAPQASITAANPGALRPMGHSRLRPRFAPAVVKDVPTSQPAIAAQPQADTKTTQPAEPAPQSAVPQPATEPVATNTSQNPLARIQEIKQIVNSKVGNPVNLIDANNAVGREYMNALLDAMKKSSGGDEGGELKVAMSRLEAAFVNVEALINDPTFKVAPGPATPATAAAPADLPTTTAAPKTVAKVAVRSEETEVKEKAAPSSEPVPAPAAPVEPPKPVEAPQPTPAPAAVKPTPAPAPTAPTSSTVSPLQKLTSQLNSGTTPVTATTPKATPVPKETPVTTAQPASAGGAQLKSVAAVETLPEKMSTLKKVMDKKDADDKKVFGDDVMDERVTQGLTDLLSNWTLFKRSGLLGTGPSGMEHPLFMKLRTLPMAAVISGRFEGATPQIKQSITDYMNGWRYEQGITHEMNEEFEHYLRRVILHILKKHQQNNPSS